MSHTVIAETPTFSHREVLQFLSRHYQLTGQLKELPGYLDQNLLLTGAGGQRYIVKIANSGESRLELEMQNGAMIHLTKKGLPVPQPVANSDGGDVTDICSAAGQTFYLRLLTFLPGVFYADLPPAAVTATLWSDLGHFVATVDRSLADFQHPGAYRYLIWDLAQGYGVCQTRKHLLGTAGSREQSDLIDYFLRLYQTQTMPLLSQLPQGIIHNDANDMNLLVDDRLQPTRITGLIDFGDMVHSHVVNDLAITAAYALMNQPEPLETLSVLVAGYHQVRPLTDVELEVLFSLIALRLCVSVCNSAEAIAAAPDNEYLVVSARPAWQLLERLRRLNPYAVQCRLRRACGLKVDGGKEKDDIIAYRKKHLGKTLSLSYKSPLKIVRGQGAYLYDEAGNGYLDMVNNVCHVGHCHPTVVAAGQAQMARLNTNTRYLHDNLVDYADQLLATMPEELSVCMFVNSGSEANELAFRLARCFTGSKELLVVDGAYHGNTNACIEASPYKFDGPGGEGAAPHVHKVALPDPYRGEFPGYSRETGAAYAASVAAALADLAAAGKSPGAFICESLQGVAGQIIMPDGYLENVYPLVRKAGGVCIADEVQVGFGRVGTHMWAFETQNVVPDIVTLGKPIGNGHPLAAVVTTQKIADAFVTGMEYFNTFGGNPVSCAIGMAVLKAIREDKLQENALETGEYFRSQLRELQREYPLIGDVRGLGLFIGVELVDDRDSKKPATETAARVIEYFKQHKILLSTEGPFHNVLKIKPPLAFNRDDADTFITVFAAGLKSDFQRVLA